MDFATLIGIITAFALIVIAIKTNSSLILFVNLPSFLIVLGGTIGATLINYSLGEFLNLLKALKYAIFFKEPEIDEIKDELIRLSYNARKNGIMSLEKELENINDLLLKKALILAIDGMNAENIREIMETHLYNLTLRHKVGYEILESMANYSPAMGLIGTLIGLVQMLQQMNEPSTIGPAMAVALITTFYGAILSNLIFMPLSGKLKRKSEKEIFFKQIYIEGVISIAKGENPLILKNKIEAFFSLKEIEEGK